MTKRELKDLIVLFKDDTFGFIPTTVPEESDLNIAHTKNIYQTITEKMRDLHNKLKFDRPSPLVSN